MIISRYYTCYNACSLHGECVNGMLSWYAAGMTGMGIVLAGSMAKARSVSLLRTYAFNVKCMDGMVMTLVRACLVQQVYECCGECMSVMVSV